MTILLRFVAIALCFLPLYLDAQTGSLSGRITETGSKNPAVGASVRLTNISDTTKFFGAIFGAVSNAQGRYSIKNIPVGDYRLNITSIGLKQFSKNISIKEAETFDTSLEVDEIHLNAVVVSASRRQERALDAPASISIVDAKQIAEHPTVTPIDNLRGASGIDISQSGLVQQSIAVRGFSGVFNSSMMVLSDYRLAGIPSLRGNVPSFIPLTNDDIDHIEIVRGPGSALYGPNASNGVVNIISKTPFASQGTSVSLTGGEQSFFQGTLRHAGTFGSNIGYKISGRYFRGEDFQFNDTVETQARAVILADTVAKVKADTLKVGKRDKTIESYSMEARMDFIIGENMSANITYGLNKSIRMVQQTDVGASESQNWTYSFLQGRFDYGDLFVQAFLNKSDAGDSYQLRTGQLLVDNSSLFVVRTQHSYSFSEMERLTYGVDVSLTRPDTKGTINGRNENSDNTDEIGAYLQSETHFFDKKFDLVLAGRVDNHSHLENPVFSPRAAIVFHPIENNNFRLTYNRAFTTPSTTDLFLDIAVQSDVFGLSAINPNWAVPVYGEGTPTAGYHIAYANDGAPVMHSQFSTNKADGFSINEAPNRTWIPAITIVSQDPIFVQQLQAIGLDAASIALIQAALQTIPAPATGLVHTSLGMLNPATADFDPATTPKDISSLRPTINQTIELGYKGVIDNKLQIGIDAYYSKVKDFIGPLQNYTPNVFMSATDAATYMKPILKQGLKSFGYPDSTAEMYANLLAGGVSAGMAKIPLGTVTPKEATDPTAIMFVGLNYGDIDIRGIDCEVSYLMNSEWTFAGTYSHISQTYFEKLDGISDLALNSPCHKASLTTNYRNQIAGLSAELRYRWTDGFRMNSGVYVGSVGSYHLVDLNISYEIPSYKGLTATLSALNLLNNKHQEFVGAAEIGRWTTLRVQYNF